MCLDAVDVSFSIEKNHRMHGWKVMLKDPEGDLRFAVQGNRSRSVKLGEWISEVKWRDWKHVGSEATLLSCMSEQEYPFGFHVFANRKDATDYMYSMYSTHGHNELSHGWSYVLVRVEFSGIHTRGLHYSGVHDSGGEKFGICYVARLMRVEAEEEEITKEDD